MVLISRMALSIFFDHLKIRINSLNFFFGNNSAGVTPDPISNSEVKPACADGTAGLSCGRVGRCRSYLEPPKQFLGGFFYEKPGTSLESGWNFRLTDAVSTPTKTSFGFWGVKVESKAIFKVIVICAAFFTFPVHLLHQVRI